MDPLWAYWIAAATLVMILILYLKKRTFVKRRPKTLLPALDFTSYLLTSLTLLFVVYNAGGQLAEDFRAQTQQNFWFPLTHWATYAALALLAGFVFGAWRRGVVYVDAFKEDVEALRTALASDN